MKALIVSMTFAASLLTATGSYAAQAPADAPPGTTGLCKDGTWYSGTSKKGACHGHQGVKDWYGAPAGAATAPPAATAPAAATAPTAAQPPAPQPKPSSAAPATPSKSVAAKAPAAGGGPGQVWANTSSKVYHCPGDKYYGNTKHGEYMSEAQAKAQGFHPDHGKPCQ